MLTNEGGYQSLLMPYTLPKDGGMYECIARNRAGEGKFTVQLTVEGKRIGTFLCNILSVWKLRVSEWQLL